MQGYALQMLEPCDPRCAPTGCPADEDQLGMDGRVYTGFVAGRDSFEGWPILGRVPSLVARAQAWLQAKEIGVAVIGNGPGRSQQRRGLAVRLRPAGHVNN